MMSRLISVLIHFNNASALQCKHMFMACHIVHMSIHMFMILLPLFNFLRFNAMCNASKYYQLLTLYILIYKIAGLCFRHYAHYSMICLV